MAQAQIRQADYTDYSNSFNELDFVIRQKISNINTAIVVKVVKVKTDTKSVDVLPMVQQISAGGSVVDHGTVYNIPYFMLQGGVNAIFITPAVDDIGLLVCCSRDISSVKNAKQVAPPSSRRMHTFSDGLYIGGFLNQDPLQFIDFNESDINVVPIEKFKYNGIEVATINDVKQVDNNAKSAIASTNKALMAESQRSSESEYVLQENLKLEQKRAESAEAEEKARAEAAETVLAAAIVAETTRAQTAENQLHLDIVAETNRATSAETQLHLDIVAETTRATAAETQLNVNIVAETTRATSAETQLNININDEKTRAEGAEASLAAAISTLGGEVSSGGAALSGEIAAVSSALSAETTNRTTADTDLQTQITAVLGKIIGYQQEWKDKMSLRNADVTYTNDTDRPIMVNITVGNTPSNRYFFIVNGVNVAQTSTEVLQNVSFIVQIGGTYKYANPSVSSSNGEIRTWSELTSSTT